MCFYLVIGFWLICWSIIIHSSLYLSEYTYLKVYIYVYIVVYIYILWRGTFYHAHIIANFKINLQHRITDCLHTVDQLIGAHELLDNQLTNYNNPYLGKNTFNQNKYSHLYFFYFCLHVTPSHIGLDTHTHTHTSHWRFSPHRRGPKRILVRVHGWDSRAHERPGRWHLVNSYQTRIWQFVCFEWTSITSCGQRLG